MGSLFFQTIETLVKVIVDRKKMEEVRDIEKANGFLPSSEKETSLFYSGFQVANVGSGITSVAF